MATKCPFCGYKNRDNSSPFCPKCGQQLNDNASSLLGSSVGAASPVTTSSIAPASDQLLYAFDHRRRTLIAAASLLTITALLVFSTIEYNLPFFGLSGGSGYGMLYFIMMAGIFAVFALAGVFRAKRFEFYDDHVQVIPRGGASEAVPYSELYLTPLAEGKNNVFRLTRYRNKVRVASWAFTNDKIATGPGLKKKRLLDVILPRMTSSLSSLTSAEEEQRPDHVDASKSRRFELFGILGAC